MPAAAIGAVGAVAGGVASGKGAKKAAKIQAAAVDKQNALAREFYTKNEGYFSPTIQSGDRAENRINQLLGLAKGGKDPTELLRRTPGYQYRMNEALGSVNASVASRGMSRSGAALKALQDRAYNVADQSFNTYVGQVGDVANRGLGAKSSLAGINQNFVATTGANNQIKADAQSNNALFQAQNFNNTLSSVLGSVGGMFPGASSTASSFSTGSTGTTNGGANWGNLPHYLRG